VLGCAKDPVRIGVVAPLTGDFSSYGEMCVKGIKLAASLINEKGGINGRWVELLVEDNQGKKEVTRDAIEKLNKEGVVAVIGPFTTESTEWVGDYADEISLPLITPTATGTEATRNREWVWRISFTDPFQGIALGKFAVEHLKASTVCILTSHGDPYSIGLAETFENEFISKGGKVLYKTCFAAGDTTFDEQLSIVKRQNPDCVFVPAFYREAGLIVCQARDMGIEQPFIGGDGWDSPEFQEIVGDRHGANYYSTHFFYNYGGAEVQEFLHGFKTEYESQPGTFSALGYDALKVVEKCLNLTKGMTREEFKENMRKVNILGATGTIEFTGTRDPRRSLMVLKFEPGKPIEVVTTF
jgi:branched-chain amino acid transport system substrate-binding protein